MPQITATYQGTLRTEVVHEDGHVVTSAAPTEFGGAGDDYGPTDLVAAALASCILTVAAVYAKGHGFDLDGATATVDKQTEGGGIVALGLVVKLPDSVPVDVRPELEETARACPVRASLHPDISAPVEFVYSET